MSASFALTLRRRASFPVYSVLYLTVRASFASALRRQRIYSDTLFISASFLYTLHRQCILPVPSFVRASLFDTLFDRPHIYALRQRISCPTLSPTSAFLYALHLCIFPISWPPRPTAHLSVLCRLHPTFAPIDSFHFMHQAPPPNVWCIIHKTAAYAKIEPSRLKAVVEIELTAISKPWDGYIVSPTWTVPRDPKINIDIISRTLAGRVDKTDHM